MSIKKRNITQFFYTNQRPAVENMPYEYDGIYVHFERMCAPVLKYRSSENF